MANKKQKILIFTENFGKRILAKDIVGINNLQDALNSPHGKNKDRFVLEGVSSSYKNNKGIYIPKDHLRGYQIINANDIDFVFGPEELIYSKKNSTTSTDVSILWDMKGLHHALIGDIKIPGNYPLNFNEKDPDQVRMKKELDLTSHLTRKLNKNFISFYNPRTDSEDAKKEFASLFKGIRMPKISKLLVNDKLKSKSAAGQAVYLGKNSNKNYR